MKKNLNIAYLNGADIGKKVINVVETINNQDKDIDITENGSVEVVADNGYSGLGKVTVNVEVASSGGGSSKPKWTGHADVEGLKAIGWTDEDIAYYQENGVNWNEEDDQYHKVLEDNIALYGVLTASNISTYKDRIVYLPKIDTAKITNMYRTFQGVDSLVAIPMLDTSNVTNMNSMFSNCYSLASIPQLDTSKVTIMKDMFSNCYSLASIPQLDTSKVTDMNSMFAYCYSLASIPQLDTSKVMIMNRMFEYCTSLVTIPMLDTSNVTSMNSMFLRATSLTTLNSVLDVSLISSEINMNYAISISNIKIKNIKVNYTAQTSPFLSKESILFIINNEAATSAITITLSSYCYTKYAEDADVVAALSNHPNVSLAK